MSELIPFGKYKGQPVEVLMNDRPYLEWLRGQDWFINRYQNINTLIINNFREPTETPEHNLLQTLFLDELFVRKFLAHLQKIGLFKDQFSEEENCRNFWKRFEKYNIRFEENGVDVLLINENWYDKIKIELKPHLSHDYPAVLRQLKGLKCDVLFIGSFSAEGISLEQVEKMFDPIKIITNSDLI